MRFRINAKIEIIIRKKKRTFYKICHTHSSLWLLPTSVPTVDDKHTLIISRQEVYPSYILMRIGLITSPKSIYKQIPVRWPGYKIE